MLCAILHYLYNLKTVKNTHGGVTFNTPPWAFITFFKLLKLYKIAQSV